MEILEFPQGVERDLILALEALKYLTCKYGQLVWVGHEVVQSPGQDSCGSFTTSGGQHRERCVDDPNVKAFLAFPPPDHIGHDIWPLQLPVEAPVYLVRDLCEVLELHLLQ